mgnify:CR=1 FL=1
MNTVSLTGRLGAEPELKTTQSGISVLSFRLAVRRPRVKDTTDWIPCVAWRHTAEFIAKYARKGDGLRSQVFSQAENTKTETATDAPYMKFSVKA